MQDTAGIGQISISLFSGLLGIFVGTLLNFFFVNRADKRKEISEYKNLLRKKLDALWKNASIFLSKPHADNSLNLSSYLQDIINLLLYFQAILRKKKDHRHIKSVRTKIQETKESIEEKHTFALNQAVEVPGPNSHILRKLSYVKAQNDQDDRKQLCRVEIKQMIDNAHFETSQIGVRKNKSSDVKDIPY